MTEQDNIRRKMHPKMADIKSGIEYPSVEDNTLEIKTSLIQIVRQDQFRGSPFENPAKHVKTFKDHYSTVKFNGVSADAIKLRILMHSFKDDARDSLDSFPGHMFSTWAELADKFFEEYYPPAKNTQLRNKISQFKQFSGESLHEAWYRYKAMLRDCQHHQILEWMIIQIFYNGCEPQVRVHLDALAGGPLTDKSEADGLKIIEAMSSNNHEWAKRVGRRKSPMCKQMTGSLPYKHKSHN